MPKIEKMPMWIARYRCVMRVGITAVSFLSTEYVACAQGDVIRIHDNERLKLADEKRLSSDEATAGVVIHGFTNVCASCGLFAVWGSRFIQFMTFDSCSGRISERGGAVDVGDWIFDASLASQGDCSTHLAVTALGHCTLTTYRLDGKECFRSTSTPPVLLYCANVRVLDGVATIVAGTMDGQVLQWDVPFLRRVTEEENPPRSIIGHVAGSVLAVQISSVNGLVASCSDDRIVQVLGAGKFGTRLRPWCVQWLQDGRVACGTEEGLLYCFNQQGEILSEKHISKAGVRRIAVSADSKWILCGCDDGSLVLVTSAASENFVTKAAVSVPQFEKKSQKLRLLHISPSSGTVLAAFGSALYDGLECIYSKMDSPIVFVQNVGNRLIVAHKSGFLSWQGTFPIKVFPSIVSCALDAEEEDLLVIASFNGFRVLLLSNLADAATRDEQILLGLAKKESITACSIKKKNDGWVAVFGTSSGGLWIVDGHLTTHLPSSHTLTVTDVVFRDNFLYSACRDGRIGKWQHKKGGEWSLVSMGRPRCIRRAECVEAFIGGEFARVYSARGCHICHIDNLDDTDAQVAFLPGILPRSLFGASIMKDTLRIATFTNDTIHTVDYACRSSWSRVLQRAGHSAIVNAVAVRPSDGCIASGADNGRFALWSRDLGSAPFAWGKCGHGIRSLCWVNEHLWVVTASHLYVHYPCGTQKYCVKFQELDADSSRRSMWLCVSQDLAFVGDSAGRVTQFQCDNEKRKPTVSRSAVLIGSFCLTEGCITGDGKFLVCVSTRGYCFHLDKQTLEIVSEVRLSAAALSSVCAWNAADAVVCAGDDPRMGWLVDASGVISTVEMGHSASIASLSTWNGKLFSLGKDQLVCMYDSNLHQTRQFAVSVVHPNSLQVLGSTAAAATATVEEDDGGFVIFTGGGSGIDALPTEEDLKF